VLGIQERTNSLGFALASRASLDKIYNPILLDAIVQSVCFDDPES
jgi:hypothetical protein